MPDDYNTVPREIFTIHEVMARIAVIQSFEEDKYSDVPKWDGMVDSWTSNAVLLHFSRAPYDKWPSRIKWFPFSQLRKAEDGLSIYATLWLLQKKLF